MTTIFRVGTYLKCISPHLYNSKLISEGTEGIIVNIAGLKCMIRTDIENNLSISISALEHLWSIDIYKELDIIGLDENYLKIIKNFPKYLSFDIKKYFLDLRRSGLQSSDFIKEMKIHVDAICMDRALK